MAASGDVVCTERVDHILRATDPRAGSFPVVGVTEFRDGKISSWREYFDSAEPRAAVVTRRRIPRVGYLRFLRLPKRFFLVVKSLMMSGAAALTISSASSRSAAMSAPSGSDSGGS